MQNKLVRPSAQRDFLVQSHSRIPQGGMDMFAQMTRMRRTIGARFLEAPMALLAGLQVTVRWKGAETNPIEQEVVQDSIL